MADRELMVLLMLEAIDKASKVIEGVTGKLDGVGESAKAAADKAALTGEELQAAQVKAEAAANAMKAAGEQQAAAQAKLLESTTAVRDAQSAATEAAARLAEADRAVASGVQDAANIAQVSYAEIAKAAETSAAAAKSAVAEQIAALDALKKADADVAVRSAESAAAQDAIATKSDASGSKLKALTGVAGITAAAVAGIGYESVKAAANFQSATTVLVTSGGETEQNIEMVRQGILNLASSTGTATQQLINGMYMIGSAGYTGQAGLNVLKAAAQGAKAENADLGTVSNALTTILNDYGVTAKAVAGDQTIANAAMDQMIAIVSNGKTTTEQLASSLSKVLPSAKAAGLSLADVGGAMATLTSQGVSADQSAQDLNNTIINLHGPSQVAAKEMAQFGLNANSVSLQLSSKGLAGTIKTLTDTIQAHMGPAGLTVVNAFQNSAAATQNLNTIMASVPANIKGLATSIVNGTISTKELRTATQGLSIDQAKQISQIASLVGQSHQFNDALTKGTPAQQTAAKALQAMLGGQTGLNTALMLSTNSYATVASNTTMVAEAAKGAGKDVNGWAEIQGTMNQRLAELKQSVEAAAIQLGTALLPMVTKILDAVMKVVAPIATWIEHNKTLAAVLLLVVGALATGITVFVMAAKAIEMVKAAMVTFGLVATETGEESALAFGPIGIAIAAVAAAAILIVTHWSTVKRWLSDFWGWFKGIFNDAKSFVAKWWPELLAPMTGGMSIVAKFVIDHWNQIFGFLKRIWGALVGAWNDTGGALIANIEKAWGEVSDAVTAEWNKISGDLSSIWQSLVTIWNATGGRLVALITGHWQTITAVFRVALGEIEGVVRPPLQLIETIVKVALSGLVEDFKLAWGLISGGAKAAWDFLSGMIKASLDVIEGIFKAAWDIVLGIVKAVWAAITTVINVVLDTLKGVFKVFADLVTGQWGKLWNDVKSTVSAVWNDIYHFFTSILGDIGQAVSGAASSIWHGFTSAIGDAVSGIWNALMQVWSTITGFFSGAGSWLLDAGKKILSGLIDGAKSVVGDVKNFFTSIGSDIISWKGPPSYDAVMLTGNGQLIMKGLITGIDSQTDALRSKLGQITTTVKTDLVAPRTLGQAFAAGLGPAASQGAAGGAVVHQTFTGNYLMSDSDMTKFATMVGGKVVTHLAPQGGVNLTLR